MRHCANVGLMLVHRLRSWNSIKTTLAVVLWCSVLMNNQYNMPPSKPSRHGASTQRCLTGGTSFEMLDRQSDSTEPTFCLGWMVVQYATFELTQGIHPMLFQCWASFKDGGPTLKQHRVNAPC